MIVTSVGVNERLISIFFFRSGFANFRAYFFQICKTRSETAKSDLVEVEIFRCKSESARL